MGQKIRTDLMCLACGRSGIDPANGGRCACGAKTWARIPGRPTSPAGQARLAPNATRESRQENDLSRHRSARAASLHTPRLVRLSETTERMIVHPYDRSELARVLEGIRENGTILLAGHGGVGKSTAAAELAAVVAEARDGLAYWLDRDQQAHDLVAALFERVGAENDRVVLVEESLGGGAEALTWQAALACVPSSAACVVVDSLETWSTSYAEQTALARVAAQHPATVKLILCGTNAAGDLEGLARLRRAGDAVVVLRADAWEVQKCRWLPDCPRLIPRDPSADEPGTPPRNLH